MRRHSRVIAWLLVFVVVLQWGPALDACTILGVGRKATVDGSGVITHNDDSSVADYPLRIVPAADRTPEMRFAGLRERGTRGGMPGP